MDWDSRNVFISVLHFSKDIKLAMSPRTCSFLLVLLQREETCLSELSPESIKFPGKLSCMLVISEASVINTSIRVVKLKRK